MVSRMVGTAIVALTLLFVAWWRAGLDLFSATTWLPGWWPAAIGWAGFVILGVAFAVIIAVGDMAARRDDVPTTGIAGSVSSIGQALGLVLILFVVWQAFDSIRELLFSIVLAAPFVIVLIFGFWYFQHRRQVATSRTAIDRTRRTAERNIENWAQVGVGIVVLALAAVFAFLSGAFAALSGFGDVLLPFAPVFAYLGTVATGFIQLGGSLPGDWLVPDLSPMQWAGFALLIGGIAIMVRQ